MPLQRSLFETARPSNVSPNWRPPEPPSLNGVNEIILDCETTGLRWWAGDLPIGIALGYRDGRARYLPFRHAGGNLDEETMKRWARRELRDKLVYLFNGPFDINMMYMWGVDLEAQGCTVSDIGNYAALLDDHRVSSTLDSIARDCLGAGKVEGIDTRRMAEYHAAEVTSYAETDVVLVNELRDFFWPKLDAEDLQRARKLEDDCIYVTCEMMRNGAPLDVEKLDSWVAKSEQDYYECLWKIHKLTGLKINPRSPLDQQRLFDHIKVPSPTWIDPKGDGKAKVTFRKDKLQDLNHPVIKILYHTKRLASLRSKYLVKYQDEIKKHGRLIYSLHQMPIDDEGGTKFGRYSSSGFGGDTRDGINVQQVAGKKQQASVKGDEDLEGYVIRELFVPESGLWLSGDANQVEFRFFAHYGKPPHVLEAYKKDPRTNFHKVVQAMIQEIKEISYERTKDCNFAEIYGAQLSTVAEMIGLSEKEARPFDTAYHKALPEVRELLDKASNLAESRGYVKTMMGRRARFSWIEPKYPALNRVIQGSAAEENKLKLVELHKARHETGFKLRFTVHDEADGDVPDVEAAKKVQEILNRQILPTIVPLLWDVGTGPNWKAASSVDKETPFAKMHQVQEERGQKAGGIAARARQEERR